ncbi:MAG: hypothetical protein ACU0BF_00815 [Paracoccaceae bacterium]
MADLAPAARDVMRRVAAGMGLELPADAAGPVVLDYDRTGRLAVMASDDEARVIVSLTAPLSVTGAAARGALLALAGHDPATGQVVRAGLSGDDRAVLSTDRPMQGFDQPDFEAALAQLRALAARLG